MMTAEMIEELGHRVVAEAGDIQSAISLAETTIFHLAILDVNISGHNISPVADVIERRGLPIVFASGYGSAALPETYNGRPLLRKPFLISDLKEAIDTILDAGGYPD